MSNYDYEITPRLDNLGGGVFPPVEGIEGAGEALHAMLRIAEALALPGVGAVRH